MPGFLLFRSKTDFPGHNSKTQDPRGLKRERTAETRERLPAKMLRKLSDDPALYAHRRDSSSRVFPPRAYTDI